MAVHTGQSSKEILVVRPRLSERPIRPYVFKHEIGYMNGLLRRSKYKTVSELVRAALDFYSKKGIKDEKNK